MMTEIEKLQERINSTKGAIESTQHASSLDRKLGDKHHVSGHFTRALTELTNELNHLQSLLERVQRQSS